MTTASSLQITPSAAPGYTAATVTGGDLVVVRGRLRRVVEANETTATVCSTQSGNDRVPWHEVSDRVTAISVSDPDSGPPAMPIYEGLTPELALVDGTYTAVLSTDRCPEPLEASITISGGRLTGHVTTPTRPTLPVKRNH